MRQGRVIWIWALAAVMLAGAAASAAPVVLPFEDTFEAIPAYVYPSGSGWSALLIGMDGYVSAAAAHDSTRSFMLNSWPWLPRVDVLQVEAVPDRVSFEGAVQLDPLYGRQAAIGWMSGNGSAGLMWNCFRVTAKTGKVEFYGVSWANVAAYTPGTWTVVRADLDYAALRADLWVNGALAASGVEIAPKEFTYAGVGEVKLTQLVLTAPGNPDPMDWYWGNMVYFDDVRIAEWGEVGPRQVRVDVKPGANPNVVNLKSRGLLPVAILSEEGFDATQVDPATVEVAGAGVAVRGKQLKVMAHNEDVDGDGLVDMLVQVETSELDPEALAAGYAEVTGMTYGGEQFEGRDEVVLVPWK